MESRKTSAQNSEYLWIGAGTFNTLTENIVRGGLNFRFGM